MGSILFRIAQGSALGFENLLHFGLRFALPGLELRPYCEPVMSEDSMQHVREGTLWEEELHRWRHPFREDLVGSVRCPDLQNVGSMICT